MNSRLSEQHLVRCGSCYGPKIVFAEILVFYRPKICTTCIQTGHSDVRLLFVIAIGATKYQRNIQSFLLWCIYSIPCCKECLRVLRQNLMHSTSIITIREDNFKLNKDDFQGLKKHDKMYKHPAKKTAKNMRHNYKLFSFFVNIQTWHY